MTDARRIGMGGVTGSENLASRMIEAPDGAHTTIVIPLGLFQVLNNFDIYNPDSESFDPIRAVENFAAPLHYTFNRNGTGTGIEFVNDLLDGQLNRDINTYRGFIPTSQPVAYGIVAPNWGVTIPVYKKKDGTTHSVYAGGGLYLPFRGALEVDDGTWNRARGYALHQALLIIPYYVQTNPGFVALAKRTVEEVLADIV